MDDSKKITKLKKKTLVKTEFEKMRTQNKIPPMINKKTQNKTKPTPHKKSLLLYDELT